MAFTEKSNGGSTNNTTETDMVTMPGSGRVVVRAVIVYNADSINHYVTLIARLGGVSYKLCKVLLAPGDTLVQDFPVIVPGGSQANNVPRIVLGENATSAQLTFVVTYAEVS